MNFYSDNERLRSYLSHPLMEKIATLKENNFKDKDSDELAPVDAQDAIDSYDKVLEIIGGRMGSQRLGRSPRFAEHEHIGTRSALENVIRNTTGVRATGSHQRERGFQRYSILLLVGLEKTIDANHDKRLI